MNRIHLIEASGKLTAEPARTNTNFRTFQALWPNGPSIGSPQHAALVSDLRRAFPEIYAPADSAETAI